MFDGIDVSLSSVFLPSLPHCPFSSSQVVWGKIHIILILLLKATCLFHCSDYETQGLISNGSAKQGTFHCKGFKLTPIFRCSHGHRSKSFPLATLSPTIQSHLHSYWNLRDQHVLLHQHKNNASGTAAVSLSMFIDWLWLTKMSEKTNKQVAISSRQGDGCVSIILTRCWAHMSYFSSVTCGWIQN